MRTASFKYAFGIIAIIGVAIYFGVTGFQSSMMYYLSVDEVIPEQHEGRAVKVMGQVTPGSIQWFDQKRRVRFLIHGETDKRIPVSYDDMVPDNFDENRNVIILGRYASGVITAKQVIVQCPSKYEAAEYDPKAAAAHNAAQKK